MRGRTETLGNSQRRTAWWPSRSGDSRRALAALKDHCTQPPEHRAPPSSVRVAGIDNRLAESPNYLTAAQQFAEAPALAERIVTPGAYEPRSPP